MNRWLAWMLSAVLLAGTIGAISASDDDVEPPRKEQEELRKLAGTYQVIHFEHDGVKYQPNILKTMKVVLSKTADDEFHVGAQITTSKCKLWPNKKRGEVDSTYTNSIYKGKTIQGIYKVDGDKLICCYAGVGLPRPTKFETSANSGRTLYTLQRVKEKN
jgi:uncharacterized protein (TIGR03067 family)